MSLCKAFYRRPFTHGGLTVPDGGGRVNHLMARPALALFYPELAGVRQPLAGEVAARRELLTRLPFTTGYGVEIAMLIDAWEAVGLDGIAQVDLEVHHNAHQSLAALSSMSYSVLEVVARRLAARRPPARPGAVAAARSGRAAVGGDHRASAARRAWHDVGVPAEALRCVYLDLDGTLLGRAASLLHDGDGAVSLAAVRADRGLPARRHRGRADERPPRRRRSPRTRACSVSARTYSRAVRAWSSTGNKTGSAASSPRACARSQNRSRTPARQRCCSTASRGDWSTTSRGTSSARSPTSSAGSSTLPRSIARSPTPATGNLRLIDNGVVTRRSAALAALDHVRGYHLVPADVSKAAAVAAHRRARGYARDATLAVGDSREDLACAAVVGELWLVANALDARSLDSHRAGRPRQRARSLEEGYGAGVYEAVVSALMRRRAG